MAIRTCCLDINLKKSSKHDQYLRRIIIDKVNVIQSVFHPILMDNQRTSSLLYYVERYNNQAMHLAMIAGCQQKLWVSFHKNYFQMKNTSRGIKANVHKDMHFNLDTCWQFFSV